MDAHPEVIQGFANAIARAQQWIVEHTDREVAQAIIDQFPDTDLDTLEAVTARHRQIDAWNAAPMMARSALERLKLGGYSMVICDNVTHSVARELGYSAFLITSGAESLHAAFEHAVDIAKEYRRMRRKIAFLQNAVRQSRGNVLVFNRQKELCYTTEDSVPEKIRDYFVQRIGDLFENEFDFPPR